MALCVPVYHQLYNSVRWQLPACAYSEIQTKMEHTRELGCRSVESARLLLLFLEVIKRKCTSAVFQHLYQLYQLVEQNFYFDDES